MGLLIKGLLGALVVVLIGVLAKTKNYAIAGLVPLFPTFALIAHYIVASERGIEALRATIVFGMWSILPYFIYLLSLWYFTGIMRLPLALAGAVGCWGHSKNLLDFLIFLMSLLFLIEHTYLFHKTYVMLLLLFYDFFALLFHNTYI